jgi:hypothetical protein
VGIEAFVVEREATVDEPWYASCFQRDRPMFMRAPHCLKSYEISSKISSTQDRRPSLVQGTEKRSEPMLTERTESGCSNRVSGADRCRPFEAFQVCWVAAGQECSECIQRACRKTLEPAPGTLFGAAINERQLLSF